MVAECRSESWYIALSIYVILCLGGIVLLLVGLLIDQASLSRLSLPCTQRPFNCFPAQVQVVHALMAFGLFVCVFSMVALLLVPKIMRIRDGPADVRSLVLVCVTCVVLLQSWAKTRVTRIQTVGRVQPSSLETKRTHWAEWLQDEGRLLENALRAIFGDAKKTTRQGAETVFHLRTRCVAVV